MEAIESKSVVKGHLVKIRMLKTWEFLPTWKSFWAKRRSTRRLSWRQRRSRAPHPLQDYDSAIGTTDSLGNRKSISRRESRTGSLYYAIRATAVNPTRYKICDIKCSISNKSPRKTSPEASVSVCKTRIRLSLMMSSYPKSPSRRHTWRFEWLVCMKKYDISLVEGSWPACYGETFLWLSPQNAISGWPRIMGELLS